MHVLIAKTADVLDLTRPAVTHSMKKLEEQLGVKLFIRKPNKLYLSETGKYTAREAKKLSSLKRIKPLSFLGLMRLVQ